MTVTARQTMMSLMIRRSSTRGTPYDNGECGSIRRIYIAESRIQSLNGSIESADRSLHNDVERFHMAARQEDLP
jgi:hypothetical protein